MSVTNGVCGHCGSGVLEETGEHIRADLAPCFGHNLDDPLDPEFWWQNHERLVREGMMDTPFRRNPNDIKDALSMMPEAREPILDALKAAQRFHNINQHQAADETAIYTAIARLMDAGILSRPT